MNTVARPRPGAVTVDMSDPGVIFDEGDEIRALREVLRTFVAREMPREQASRWDKENRFPRDVFDKLSGLGVMGLTVPERFGGAGRNILACMIVIEELSRRSMAIAAPYIMCACYAGMNLTECASPEQQAAYLPRVAAGDLLFAYGLTEPDVGADLASIKTRVRADGDGLVINGAKRFCSGANFADYIYVLARSGPVEDRYRNLSLVLVAPDTPGVTIEMMDTMGFKGTGTTDVTFSEVRVPADALVGGPPGWNTGWDKIVGPGLAIERIEVAAMALGIAAAAFDDACEYAQGRHQFGRPISALQSVRHTLADCQTKLHASRLMLYDAAWRIDNGRPCRAQSAMAKLFVCEAAEQIVLDCQKILGAYGYSREFDMERYVRDILLMPIIGGSSAIQRNNIASARGLARTSSDG